MKTEVAKTRLKQLTLAVEFSFFFIVRLVTLRSTTHVQINFPLEDFGVVHTSIRASAREDAESVLAGLGGCRDYSSSFDQ